jgi:pyruvate/2-oxoglutarate/acetoin dehydrogenase E1 component
MLLDAVAIDDPVIFCEHKFLYYHLKAEKLPTEACQRESADCPCRTRSDDRCL